MPQLSNVEPEPVEPVVWSEIDSNRAIAWLHKCGLASKKCSIASRGIVATLTASSGGMVLDDVLDDDE